jgi:hypothetical protein
VPVVPQQQRCGFGNAIEISPIGRKPGCCPRVWVETFGPGESGNSGIVHSVYGNRRRSQCYDDGQQENFASNRSQLLSG